MRSINWAARLVVGVLLTGCARQATIESAGDVDISSTPVDARSLPSGTTLSVTLDQEIGTKSSKVGDTFVATVTDRIVAQNGATALGYSSGLFGIQRQLGTLERLATAETGALPRALLKGVERS